MTTINHEPDSYCLPLAQSTSQKPDKCCLRLLRSTYHGSHPSCVVLIITSIRTCLNLFEQFGQIEQFGQFELFEQVRTCPNKFEHVRTLRVRFEQVRSRPCTSLEISSRLLIFFSFYFFCTQTNQLINSKIVINSNL